MHVLPSGVMASGSELDKCIDLIRYEMISAVIVLAGNAGARFHQIGCGVVSELRAAAGTSYRDFLIGSASGVPGKRAISY